MLDIPVIIVDRMVDVSDDSLYTQHGLELTPYSKDRKAS